MAKYLIYKSDTGEALRVIDAPIETIEMNLQENEAFTKFTGNDYNVHFCLESKCIVGGAICSKNDTQKYNITLLDVRTKRDKLLSDTDWVTTRYMDQTGIVPIEWQQYRQALRDITDQEDIFDIAWPIMPEL